MFPVMAKQQIIKAVYGTVYQCYGVLQALHMKLWSMSWVERDPWNHDSQKAWKPLFWNFSSSSGDPSKSWTAKKCREGALTSWRGRSWSRRGCLARFRGHRPSPDLLTFPRILLPFVPLQGTLPPLTHPECSSCPPSYWSHTDSYQIHSSLNSHFRGCPPLQPKAATTTPMACPLSPSDGKGPASSAPLIPEPSSLSLLLLFLSHGSWEHIVPTWSVRGQYETLLWVSQRCSSRTQPLGLAKGLGILQVLPWE